MTDEVATGGETVAQEGAAAAEATVSANAETAAPTETPTDKTLAGGAEVVQTPVQSTFPDNWRELVAGDDKKAAKTLERMTDPTVLWKSYTEARRELDGGNRVKLPDAKSSDEEWSAFNKSLGVPDEVSGYLDKMELGSGRVLGDEDRPVFDYFAERMHKVGTPPKIMAEMTDAWLDYQNAQQEDQQTRDHDNRVNNEITLKEELGGSFTSVTNAIGTMLSQAPPELADLLTNGRAMDGTLLGDHPVVVKWLGDIATEIYPAAAMQAPDGDNLRAMGDELGELRKLMASDSSDYWTGPNAKANQARMAELLEMKARADSRRQ